MPQKLKTINTDPTLRRIDATKKRIKDLVTEEVYQKIEEYDYVMITEALADGRRKKSFNMILALTRLLRGRNWLTLSKTDIVFLVVEIMKNYSSNGKETNSTYDLKMHLKLFFRWLKLGSRSKHEVGDPPELMGIRNKKIADKLVREAMLDDADKRNLIAASKTFMDRACWDVLYESGFRPGELLSVKLKHVKDEEDGITISVDGKTGARPVLLLTCKPNLTKWLKNHPLKDDPEAPLWIKTSKNKFGQAVNYSHMVSKLRVTCRNAKINKKVNLKLFRHSAATKCAAFMTDSVMRKRFGWTKDSTMPSHYAHIVQSDVKQVILQHHGINKEEDKVKLTPKICPRCNETNSFDEEICDNCNSPLTLQKALEAEAQNKANRKLEIIQTMDELGYDRKP